MGLRLANATVALSTASLPAQKRPVNELIKEVSISCTKVVSLKSLFFCGEKEEGKGKEKKKREKEKKVRDAQSISQTKTNK